MRAWDREKAELERGQAELKEVPGGIPARMSLGLREVHEQVGLERKNVQAWPDRGLCGQKWVKRESQMPSLKTQIRGV